MPDLVKYAADLDYPALGLTDHGTMAGSVELYTACRKAGIEPLPGIELYLALDLADGVRKHRHLTVAAYTETGYRNLVRLGTRTARNYWYRPRVDLADLAEMSEAGATQGLVVSTGCFFGPLSHLLVDREDEQAADRFVTTLAGWFDRAYVELQHHGIHDEDHDDDTLVEAMRGVAQRTGVPTIVTQDSHYLRAEDKPLHEALKRLVSFSEDPDDAVFPGEGYHLADARYLSRFFEPDVLAEALGNLHELAEAASVRIPELETFSLRMPDVTLGGDPLDELESRVIPTLRERVGVDGKANAYWRRLNEELEVVDLSGYAAYLLLIAQVTDFMREQGIWFHARGSASGSVVCWLLGITQVDPVAWGLRMDRFLTADGSRVPDVDLDIERDRRHEVEEMLTQRFTVCQIGTLRTYSVKDDEDSEDQKGSLLVRYFSNARKQGREVTKWEEIPADEQDELKTLGSLGLYSGYGTHPGGYVIAPDEAALTELPMSYIASSNRMVTTFDKKAVEKLGFVKVDVLGLRELTALRLACEAIGITEHDIPLDDPAAFRRAAAGETTGIFQLKGWAMRKGCRQLKPRNLADLALAQALFRPAPMSAGWTEEYLARRFKRSTIPVRHEDIAAETKETLGLPLYQEQVIGVLRRAGMEADELNKMLSAVKASGASSLDEARETVTEAEPRVRELAEQRGWAEADVAWLLEGLAAFGSGYSFNKAHAASYALASYRGLWMVTNHPAAFWAGSLEASRDVKERVAAYTKAARESGAVHMLPAHVNTSGIGYTLDNALGAIRKGLTSIKGVGEQAAAELIDKRPFASWADLGKRCVPRRVSGAKSLALGGHPEDAGGVVAALWAARALDGLPPTESVDVNDEMEVSA